MCFDQVRPYSAFCTKVQVRADREEDATCIRSLLPDHVRGLFQLTRYQDGRDDGESDYGFIENDLVLSMDQVSGVTYIAVENIYCAIRLLAEVMEDVHFFVYSSGDDDTRWIDEYRIRDGVMLFERHIADAEIFLGRYCTWLQLTHRRSSEPGWENFIVTGITDICRSIVNPAREELLSRLVALYTDNNKVRDLCAALPASR